MMIGGEPPQEAKNTASEGRRDMWSALVLTTAGLLSAWASFQGGMWGGLETEHFHRSNAALTVSSAKAIAAGQRETEHAGLFISWLAAVSDGKEKRALFLENQFEPPFDAEFRRWRSALPDDLSTADDSSPAPNSWACSQAQPKPHKKNRKPKP